MKKHQLFLGIFMGAVIILLYYPIISRAEDTLKATGNFLISYCNDDNYKTNNGLWNYCIGFVYGTEEGIESASVIITGRPDINIYCMPSNATSQQMALVVTRYLNEHPETLNNPDVVEVIHAFTAAWPCNKLKR
jgi:Rap1a immunity proteins